MEIETTGAPGHTRTLVVSIEQRGEDEVDARGRVLDLRKRGLVPMASDLQTAGVIHDMRVGVRLDLASRRILALEVEQENVAFEPSEATGGECCRDPAPRLQALVDTPLDDATPGRLGSAFGGPLGCSHVLTLAQLLLSTAQRALSLDARRHPGARRASGRRIFHRSLSLDGGVSEGTIALAFQQADVHFRPDAPGAERAPFALLAERLEVRGVAEVEWPGMRLAALRAAERRGDSEQLFGDWHACDAPLEGIAGRSALGGMAKELIERLGKDPEQRPLLDALLNLAPALIQCVPAVMEAWQRGEASESKRPAGGLPDSCYMWRRDGALARVSERAAEAERSEERS